MKKKDVAVLQDPKTLEEAVVEQTTDPFAIPPLSGIWQQAVTPSKGRGTQAGH